VAANTTWSRRRAHITRRPLHPPGSPATGTAAARGPGRTSAIARPVRATTSTLELGAQHGPARLPAHRPAAIASELSQPHLSLRPTINWGPCRKPNPHRDTVSSCDRLLPAAATVPRNSAGWSLSHRGTTTSARALARTTASDETRRWTTDGGPLSQCASSGRLLGGCRRGGQRERASLGVPAYGPAIARVDDRAAELANALECCGQVSDREVREGSGVAGTRSTRVDSEAHGARFAFPSRSGRGGPRRELDAEDAVPEPASAIGIVGRKFDQGRGHGREYGRRVRSLVLRRVPALRGAASRPRSLRAIAARHVETRRRMRPRRRAGSRGGAVWPRGTGPRPHGGCVRRR
jgi:hypothetical protein